MSDNSKSLYNFGSITAVMSGLAMIFLGYWFTFQRDNLIESMHGVGVVISILLVPTIIATTILLIKDAKNSALLGLGFATIWIMLELLAHCSQTAPLKEIGALIDKETTQEIGTAIESVWSNSVEAMTKIGLFLFILCAVFYGISMRKWGNTISANLFIISAIVSIPTFFIGVEFNNLHLFVRGINFLFLGGVLIQAPSDSIEEIWES